MVPRILAVLLIFMVGTMCCSCTRNIETRDAQLFLDSRFGTRNPYPGESHDASKWWYLIKEPHSIHAVANTLYQDHEREWVVDYTGHVIIASCKGSGITLTCTEISTLSEKSTYESLLGIDHLIGYDVIEISLSTASPTRR